MRMVAEIAKTLLEALKLAPLRLKPASPGIPVRSSVEIYGEPDILFERFRAVLGAFESVDALEEDDLFIYKDF